MSLVHICVKDFGFVIFFIYLAEITSPTFRGFFFTLFSFNQVIMQETMETAVIEKKENQLLRNGVIITSLSFLLALFIPETPFWLASKGNLEKAEETFTWIRAGNSDATEFNQMLANIDTIASKGTIAYITSATFFIGMVFSIFLVICGFNPASLMEAGLHDFYYAYTGNMTYEEYLEARNFIKAPLNQDIRHAFYGQLIFLGFQFFIPRKLLYFVSYIFGVFIITFILLKLQTLEILLKLASFCSLSPALGITPLVMILPAEVSLCSS